MTSETPPREVFVWIWQPGKTNPVVAGRITPDGDRFTFNYGRSYLKRDDAISIFEPELPLRPGALNPTPPLEIANALRDATPDAWGRRVIINRLTGARGQDVDTFDLDELTFMLRSGSDRIGALDFQASATDYIPRENDNTPLETLLSSAERVEKGLQLAPDLAEALQHGTAIGGARPKALIQNSDAKYVAKFSSSSDTYSVVKAEFIAMRLAALVGLNVAPVELVKVMDKDVLLIQRFDRTWTDSGWIRRAMVSALTLFGLDERMAAHASYEDLANIIRARFTNPRDTLRELFGRLVFNILVGNTDDHARNHAAFWDGDYLTLTPAYDICPQSRTGREASQAMRIRGTERRSQLSLCLAAAKNFHLNETDALTMIKGQIDVICRHWNGLCDESELEDVDRRLFWRRQFLNALAFEGLDEQLDGEIQGLGAR